MTSPTIVTTSRDIKPTKSAEHPRVSVVTTSTHATDGVVDRLETLGQQGLMLIESLLVCPAGVADAIRGAASRRGIRILVAPSGSSVEDMRALGVLSAKGDVIMILGNHDTFDSVRLQALMSAAPRRAEANALRRSQ
jgi:ABC-type uncharacterized transport system substrate-binding protein